MEELVQFAVLVPDRMVEEISQMAKNGPVHFETAVKPAEEAESVMGFDPFVTPALVWVTLKFVGGAVAAGGLGAIGREIYDKLRGHASKADMVEMTARFPDGTRYSVKNADSASIEQFGKIVKERQRDRSKAS